jgi:protein-S-isoprenylcysteine O-methyltransferase Ste14
MADPPDKQTQTNPLTADHPGVIAPPVVIYLCAVLVGGGLHYYWSIGVVSYGAQRLLGGALIAVSIVLFVLAVRQMLRAGTNIPPHLPTTALVTGGPYRISRNPIYLSLSLLHLGLGVWVNSLWIVAMLAPVLVVMSFGVIAREERYLARKLGEPYLQYKSAVRRWL